MNDFKLQYASIREEVDRAIKEVLESGFFVLGENVKAFEKEFAEYCKAKFAIGVGNGLEALQLALVAHGIGEGDEVITVSNTAVATALAISNVGAKPVLVDIDAETYNIDVSKIEEKITEKTKAILPVHLFGNPADMDPILEIADRHGLIVIEDASQAHGAEYKGVKVGTLCNAGCFSFYPTKNLGAYGDGGMVITNNAEICEKIVMLRNYGRKTRYFHLIKGFNSRLDELQASILRVKLRHLDKWNEMRNNNAKVYTDMLSETDVVCPVEKDYAKHVYHLYVIRNARRDDLQNFLYQHGVSTLVHYPVPIHLQDAYKELRTLTGTLPVTEKTAREILSLPIYPELTTAQIQYVARFIQAFCKGGETY